MDQTLKELKVFAKDNMKGVDELRKELGYKTVSSIYNWFTRGKISSVAVEDVNLFLTRQRRKQRRNQ